MWATCRACFFAALIASSFATVARGQAPELRYDFKSNQHYAYEVTIEIDTEYYVETLSGYSWFHVGEVKDDVIPMSHRGELGSDRKRKPDAPPGSVFGSFRGGPEPGHFTIDRQGKLLRSSGLFPLEFVLGFMETLSIEHLPATPQNQWHWEHEFKMVESNSMVPFSFGFGPGNTRKAKEESDYVVKDVTGNMVRIEKKYRMQSGEGTAGVAHVDMTGSGTFLFDRGLGLVSSLDMNYRIETRERKETRTATAKVTCRKMDPAKLKRMITDEDDRWKRALGTLYEGLPKVPLKPGERTQLLRDLKSTDGALQEAAIDRLLWATADETPDDMAAALAVIVRDCRSLPLQTKAAKAIKVWASPVAIDVLSEAAKNSAFLAGAPEGTGFPLMNAAFEALSAIGTEQAAQAICKNIGEPSDNPAHYLISMGPVAEIPTLQFLSEGGFEKRLACEVLTEVGGVRSALPLKMASERGNYLVEAQQALEAIAKREGMTVDELLAKAERDQPRPVPAGNVYRTWTDASGTFQIEAQLLSVDTGVVKLKARTGKVIDVPIARLSQADRDFINSSQNSSPGPVPIQPPGKPSGTPRDTQLAGGSGGFPFRMVSRENEHLVGFSYHLGQWAGKQSVSINQAIFDPRRRPIPNTLMAKPGYAVGALAVDSSEFVNALCITFMRIKPDGTLDPSDTYNSPVIGTASGQTTTKLGGTGAPVVGIHGRRGAILDAVGLVICE